VPNLVEKKKGNLGRPYLSFMNDQKKLAFGDIFKKLKKLVNIHHNFQFFEHKGMYKNRQGKTSVGPTEQRGCDGMVRGSIVRS
jgi:hypothetical protein